MHDQPTDGRPEQRPDQRRDDDEVHRGEQLRLVEGADDRDPPDWHHHRRADPLQDARRDVDPAIEAAQIARFIAATGADADRFRAAYALLGAQRGLRIMGIFTRLAQRDGKRRYLAFMPRVWDAIQRDLAHPALAPLARALTGIPAPTPEVIERIAQA